MPNTSQVSLGDFFLFQELNRSRSVHATSRILKMTPSHVSKKLLRLEKKLGLQLFHRSVKGLLVTQEGRSLASTIENLQGPLNSLASIGSLDFDISQQKCLTIGAPAYLNRFLISQILPEFQQGQPERRFRLLDMAPDRLVSTGLLGAFDVAVYIGKMGWPKAWSEIELGHLEWKLFGRKGHPLGKRANEDKVLSFPFVFPVYWTPEGFYAGNDHCPVLWNQRKKGHEVSTVETAIEIVSKTDQLVFAPLIVTKHRLEKKELSCIHVPQWPKISLPLVLSVQASMIAKSLQRNFLARIQNFLEQL